MDILKRNGTTEPLKLEKISSRIKKLTYGLNERVDPDVVSTKVVSGLYDGVSSAELDQLSAETAASMVMYKSMIKSSNFGSRLGLIPVIAGTSVETCW